MRAVYGFATTEAAAELDAISIYHAFKGVADHNHLVYEWDWESDEPHRDDPHRYVTCEVEFEFEKLCDLIVFKLGVSNMFGFEKWRFYY